MNTIETQDLFNEPIAHEIFCPHERKAIVNMQMRMREWMQEDIDKLKEVTSIYYQAKARLCN